MQWDSAALSDRGRMRAGNEDAFLARPDHGLFAVADGMGGHAAGEVASELAADTALQRLARAVDGGAADDELADALADGFAAAHRAICTCCTDDPRTRGMGTTLTVCVLNPAGTFRAGHIGDSRLYRMRAGLLDQLSHDHTWVQREVDAGRLTREAARRHPLSHIVSRVLSEDLPPDADLLEGSLLPGDLLLLATDGLYNMLEDGAIAELMAGGADLPARAAALVAAANRAGGADNITVVLIRILPR